MPAVSRRLLVITLGLTFLGAPDVLGQTIKDFCSIRSENLLSGRNHNALSGAVFDVIPPNTEREATRTHRPSVAVIYQIPRDKAEYAAVFSSRWDNGVKIRPDDVSAVAVTEMQKARDLAKQNNDNIDSEAKTVSDLYGLINNSMDDFIVIVGHSEDGNFKTRDGEDTQIVEIANRCRALDKVCVIVSCNSKDYLTDGSHGITRSITLDEGVFIASAVRVWISSRDYPLNPEVVSLFVKSVQLRAFVRFHVSYVIVRGCGAATSLTAVDLLVEGIEEPTCPCLLPK